MKVYAVVTPKAEYRLTKLGLRLLKTIQLSAELRAAAR
jgi:DNA-binding HxlR family transcriptional regulator